MYLGIPWPTKKWLTSLEKLLQLCLNMLYVPGLQVAESRILILVVSFFFIILKGGEFVERFMIRINAQIKTSKINVEYNILCLKL